MDHVVGDFVDNEFNTKGPEGTAPLELRIQHKLTHSLLSCQKILLTNVQSNQIKDILEGGQTQ